jgi:hypothetical protein
MKTVEYEKIPEKKVLLGMTLVDRINNFALYATDCRSFEVHLIKTVANHYDKWTDTLFKRKEMLAKSEEFGANAWCYDRLSTVYRYFGIFAPHHDEIIRALHNNGFTLVTDARDPIDGLGYLL